MVHQKLIQKLNTQEDLLLNEEEIAHIIKNWVSLHTQHHVSTPDIALSIGGESAGIVATLSIDKTSIYKH